MRTMLRGKITLLFMTFGLLLAIPAIALADQLGNDLDTNALDANFEQISFAVGDSAKTVNLALFSQGSGPERDLTTPSAPNSPVVVEGGCNVGNLSDTEEIEVQAISSGSAASVKWAATGTDKVKFAACSDLQTRALTVTPGTVDDESTAGTDEGTANVTFKITSTGFTELASPNTGIWQEPDGSGRYDLNTARFTVNVTPPPNTPPSVSVTGVEHGATYDKGAVPAAGCSVSDAEDTGESATPQVVTPSLLDSDGLGLETVRCSYTDGGGLTTTASATYTIRDPSPPVITKTVTGQQGNNGWYTSNVSVDWTVTEPQSPNSLQLTGCEDQNITSDQAEQTYSCSATSAGGSAEEQSVTIKRDATAPVINDDGTTQSPNGALWFNSAVVNDFSATDATPGSGLASAASFTKSSGTAEGSAVKINSGPVSDLAGNTNAGIDSAAFKIDLTKPSVNVTGVTNGATYTTGNVPTPGCNTTDGLSGVKTHATVSVTGGTGGFGTLTATCSGAVDNADNNQATTTPVSVTYGVSAAFNGFLQPIDGHAVNTGKYGRTYPIKWQLRDSSGALLSDTTAQLLVATMTGGQKLVTCNNFTLEPEDALEEATTGNTSLRYDATSDQFIYNYKAPSSGGPCFVFAIRNADGLTTQQIDFKFTK
jgi:hypothetical protein